MKIYNRNNYGQVYKTDDLTVFYTLTLEEKEIINRVKDIVTDEFVSKINNMSSRIDSIEALEYGN